MKRTAGERKKEVKAFYALWDALSDILEDPHVDLAPRGGFEELRRYGLEAIEKAQAVKTFLRPY